MSDFPSAAVASSNNSYNSNPAAPNPTNADAVVAMGSLLPSISLPLPLPLPQNLWKQALAQFDALALTGKLLHGPCTTTIHSEANPNTNTSDNENNNNNNNNSKNTFRAAFQLAPHLNKKPFLPADAPERRTNNAKSNPFANPDTDFLIGDGDGAGAVGRDHVLMLNKFCVYRPSLLLVTKEYVPQLRPLEPQDLRAVWAVLVHLEGEVGKRELVAIYNCGAESGSSQGHKHLQILPKLRTGEGELFELFPGRVVEQLAGSDGSLEPGREGDVSGVAHKHFVQSLGEDVTAEAVVRVHETLYARMRAWVLASKMRDGDFGGVVREVPHNVVMTRDWMCLIPRRRSGSDRGTPANALGMVGVVWTTREGEGERWVRQSGSVKEHLAYLGYPID